MKAILLSIVAVLFGGFLLWSDGPEALSNLTVDQSELVRSSHHRIIEAECRTKVFIISSCSVRGQHVTSGEETFFSYTLFGRMAGESVQIMTVPKTGYLTTSTGVDHAINQMIMLLLSGAIFLGGGFYWLYQTLFCRRRSTQLSYR